MQYVDLPTWAKNLYTQTTARAKKRGDAFWLTRDEYAAIYSERCSITGILFDSAPPRARHQKRPFAASIDRIDCAKGYEAGNCRLVCVAANIAMNAWGEDVLYRLALGLVSNRKSWQTGKLSWGRLPKGVQLVRLTENGATYRGSKYVGGVRKYTRHLPTPEAVLDALAANDFSGPNSAQ